VGCTRTAPAPAAEPKELRFAYASCQNWQDGFYPAYRHLAEEDLDFVAFLGDYIYEHVPRSTALRRHDGTGEPYSLVEYRNRHALYKTDSDLQRAHAAFPWIVTLDDHEIDNNWADEIPQDPDKQTHEAFLARRAAAFQAYYEHMPLRRESLPRDIDMRLYRRVRYGNLATIHVLDTRQYRSNQPVDLAGANDPSRTMTGTDQEHWLVAGMANADARWNLLANQTMMASNDRKAGIEQAFDFDNWDGYRVQRRGWWSSSARAVPANPVVLTGDRHATWVCDLKIDFDDPDSPVVGAEITGTSISSDGDPNTDAFHRAYGPIMAESPHWKYIDNRRGYIRCEVTPEQLLATLRTVSTVRSYDATITSAASFVVESGRPGIEVADDDGGQLVIVGPAA
jgi:alkaline phosphatase D